MAPWGRGGGKKSHGQLCNFCPPSPRGEYTVEIFKTVLTKGTRNNRDNVYEGMATLILSLARLDMNWDARCKIYHIYYSTNLPNRWSKKNPNVSGSSIWQNRNLYENLCLIRKYEWFYSSGALKDHTTCYFKRPDHRFLHFYRSCQRYEQVDIWVCYQVNFGVNVGVVVGVNVGVGVWVEVGMGVGLDP